MLDPVTKLRRTNTELYGGKIELEYYINLAREMVNNFRGDILITWGRPASSFLFSEFEVYQEKACLHRHDAAGNHHVGFILRHESLPPLQVLAFGHPEYYLRYAPNERIALANESFKLLNDLHVQTTPFIRQKVPAPEKIRQWTELNAAELKIFGRTRCRFSPSCGRAFKDTRKSRYYHKNIYYPHLVRRQEKSSRKKAGKAWIPCDLPDPCHRKLKNTSRGRASHKL